MASRSNMTAAAPGTGVNVSWHGVFRDDESGLVSFEVCIEIICNASAWLPVNVPFTHYHILAPLLTGSAAFGGFTK
eukprot:3562248-Prymnesium_polylepis.1